MKKYFTFVLLFMILLLASCSNLNTISSTPTSSQPTSTKPSATTPSNTKPNTTVPSTTKPSTTVPSTTKPSTTTPSTTTPGPVVLNETTLYCVGDSTMCSFADAYYLPRYGYGTQLANYFNDLVSVSNLALSGRSSKSFLSEANYTTLKNNIKKGDYLLIGFGHNDEKYDDSTRFTDASKPLTDTTSFKYSLYENYIKLAIDAEATPILATPIVRANSSNDYSGSSAHIVSGYGDYAQAIRELGQEVNVTVIDLTAITKAQYTKLGYSEAMYYHAFTAGKYDTDGVTIIPNPSSIDATHINKYGAKFVAYSFAEALKNSDNPLGKYVLDDISAPTKEVDYQASINKNYVVPSYAAPNLGSYVPNATFATISSGWYGTAFGDLGGDPIGKGFTAKETTAGVFTVGNANANGKITTTEGISFLFKQISVKDNFKITADVTIKSQASKTQAGFGLMLRDDCYLPIKDASILSNYVAAGMYTSGSTTAPVTNIVYSRENSKLTTAAGTVSALYNTNDTATLSIERIGQVVICKVVYNSTEYSKTYTDFDFVAVDNNYMYVGMYANRGTIAEFTNVAYTYTGESQGA